jgi:alkyl sulfatase BDS1-like metallo-beta-lactamase superfamily hydrolase
MRIILALIAVFAFGHAHAQATSATRAANVRMGEALPWADREDEDFAARGFIAAPTEPQVRAEDGRVVWDFTAYNFLQGPAPETVNPSLWRHAGLITRAGLFQVRERVYQVRGFDVANMTLIVGDSGLILIDPLTSREAAAAALALARRTLGDLPVRTAMPITLLACAASSMKRTCARGACRSSPPRASWSTPSPKMSSPATPWAGARFISLARRLRLGLKGR